MKSRRVMSCDDIHLEIRIFVAGNHHFEYEWFH